MKIDINQHKISFGDKYEIFIQNQPAYKAAIEWFRLLSVIDLFEFPSGELKMKIRKRFSWRAKYDFEYPDGRVYQFRNTSFWKITYQCVAGSDVYDIYGHRGRKHSIFKNGQQIAFWDKEAVTWFEGDNYTIIANNNCDETVVIAFCLSIDNYASKNHDETVTVDWGNLGLRSVKFDKDWRPS